MKPPLLIVDSNIAVSTREETAWNNRGIATVRVNTMLEAIEMLQKMDFLFTVINADTVNYLPLLKTMRATAPSLILIGTSSFKLSEHVEAYNNGAHYYGSFYENPEKNIDSALAIYTSLVEYFGSPTKTPESLILNDMIINSRNREVFCNNILIPLTKTEFNILHFLTVNHDVFMPYEMIISNAWRSDLESASNSALHQHIYSIRDRFFKAVGHGGYIENKNGSGYRLFTFNKK